MPLLSERAENRFFGIVAIVLALATPISAYFGTRQQVILKQLDDAHIHLGGFDSFLVWLPSYVPWLALLALWALSILALRRARKPEPQIIPSETKVLIEPPPDYGNVKAEAAMLKEITPLIRAYRATHEMLGELVLFAENMEKIPPSGNIRADSERIARASQKNAADFTEHYRYRLISLCTDLRTTHGILNAKLTDEALVRDVYGVLGVKPLIDGLAEIMSELQKMLADAAGNLNV